MPASHSGLATLITVLLNLPSLAWSALAQDEGSHDQIESDEQASQHSASTLDLLEEGSLLESDELLLTDDFTLAVTEADAGSVFDALKTMLRHSHTEEEQETQLQRTTLKFGYEDAFANSWYAKLENKLDYYWAQDKQALIQNMDYMRSDWKQAWVQYSYERCAIKAGKQTLIWGEVEGTFAVDIITPFDYTEQLLTDFTDIRLSQSLIRADCFFDQQQIQLFYIPQARFNLFSHRGNRIFFTHPPASINVSGTGGEEWGGRLKKSWEGMDVSLMYAKLHSNQGQMVVNGFIPEIRHSHFELLGASASIAIGRLLFKSDLGYKTHQLVPVSSERIDVFSAAVGIEYTTRKNHSLNAGVTVDKGLERDNLLSRSPTYTLGWNKAYLNDDLAMSLLGNYATDPEFSTLTLLAQYQWDDYWNFSAAYSMVNSSHQSEQTPFIPQSDSVTLAVKVEF